MKKLKIDDALYDIIKKQADAFNISPKEAVLRKFSRKTQNQFDRTEKDGVLRRVYYYQTRRYGGVEQVTMKKFINHWKKDKNFKRIWKDYKYSNFDPMYRPTFFRHGSDKEEDKLYVAIATGLATEKVRIDMRIN